MRAARIWRPETMLLIIRLYIRLWKRRHGSLQRHQFDFACWPCPAGPLVPLAASNKILRPMACAEADRLASDRASFTNAARQVGLVALGHASCTTASVLPLDYVLR